MQEQAGGRPNNCDMEPMRFGIVGCGGIAGTHAECLKKLEDEGLAQLVAGAEPHEGRRKTFGEKWEIAMHASLDELLARDDIDAVTICSPSGLHGTHAVQIAKSKRHVLSEKPLDTKLQRADAAIQAAKENGVVLSGIFQQRFVPGALKVKRAVDQGYFGEIVYAHCETPWYRAQSYYDHDDWRGTWELDGGVLSNQAIHMIDRLMWLGGEIEEVLSATCEAGRGRKIEAETQAAAIVRLKNGALGTITGTTLSYDGFDQRTLICGTEGSALLATDRLVDFKTKRPFEEGESQAASDVHTDRPSVASEPLALWSDMHKDNIRDFIVSIQAGRSPAVKPEDMRRAVRALNMIYSKAGVGPYAGQKF